MTSPSKAVKSRNRTAQNGELEIENLKTRVSNLSNRQAQCLHYRCQAGHSIKEIAHHLGIGRSRVNQLLGKAFEKLGVKNRTEASLKLGALGAYLA